MQVFSLIVYRVLYSECPLCICGTLNNQQVGDKNFVHFSEVVPSSEVEMHGLLYERGQTVCPF